ncbi:Leucine carboxyl methyltransferase [Cinnamomum micranthum f. kanehirae]|uniref:Leucine carboxyl methyltransferase n=1 Tax=Cinnamomum micranthum f. kanehirae TaxID=337451 RepID=A0A3S3NHK6_9MAGN|nr:Leucine carboxyl methyltransferase [Cinnamomum micranthum f. kanehirae]
MGCFAAAAAAAALVPSPSSIYHCSQKKQRKIERLVGIARAKFHQGTNDDPFLEAAINAASLRFQETHRPSPLFLDPYAGCLISPFTNKDMKQYQPPTTPSCHYCIATKFIDDKLLSTLNHMEGLRQIVLLTDGMDTRPYRLNWPQSTIIFDVSPGRIFKIASERLGGIGAKISRTCMLLHVPLESSDMHRILRRKGFSGIRPSIWVFQESRLFHFLGVQIWPFFYSYVRRQAGLFLVPRPSPAQETASMPCLAWAARPIFHLYLRYNMDTGVQDEYRPRHHVPGLPVMTLSIFKEIFFAISALAAKGSIFVGELPTGFAEMEFGTKMEMQEWLDKLFMSNGFRVNMIDYEEVAKNMSLGPPSGDYGKMLFVGQQLQLSDDQMENWRREFQRMEEGGDEEGFEEL